MILVTGATGFLGSELIRQLVEKGMKVRALKRESSRIPAILQNKSEIEWRTADLLDFFELQEAMEGITHVYHCAAVISFNPSEKKEMQRVNVEGTINLLNICQSNQISKFLHVSSVATVGKSKREDVLITEKNHWEFGSGQSAYSISKYESEMEVFRAQAEGLTTVIINPGIILGKNCGNKGSGQLVEAIRNGLSYYPGGSFGYVDVEDVAEIMILLMDSNISGDRFIVSAENWSYKNFFQELAIKLNKKPPSIALKPWMLKLAYYGSKILMPVLGRRNNLTPETVKSAFNKRSYSNEKVRKALNFNFKPLRQSIAEICSV